MSPTKQQVAQFATGLSREQAELLLPTVYSAAHRLEIPNEGKVMEATGAQAATKAQVVHWLKQLPPMSRFDSPEKPKGIVSKHAQSIYESKRDAHRQCRDQLRDSFQVVADLQATLESIALQKSTNEGESQ